MTTNDKLLELAREAGKSAKSEADFAELRVHGELVVTATYRRKWESCSTQMLIYHGQHEARFSTCHSSTGGSREAAQDRWS